MKKPDPVGSMEGLKAFAHKLVSQYALGESAARFSVVSFAENATTRVGWSYSTADINDGIDDMSANGSTSISDGFGVARQLFLDDGNGTRKNATRVVLFLSDGEQTVDKAFNRTLFQTAVDAAKLVKDQGATVFAWGFGNVSVATLEQIATDPSKAILVQNISELNSYLGQLEAAVCAV